MKLPVEDTVLPNEQCLAKIGTLRKMVNNEPLVEEAELSVEAKARSLGIDPKWPDQLLGPVHVAWIVGIAERTMRNYFNAGDLGKDASTANTKNARYVVTLQEAIEFAEKPRKRRGAPRKDRGTKKKGGKKCPPPTRTG